MKRDQERTRRTQRQRHRARDHHRQRAFDQESQQQPRHCLGCSSDTTAKQQQLSDAPTNDSSAGAESSSSVPLSYPPSSTPINPLLSSSSSSSIPSNQPLSGSPSLFTPSKAPTPLTKNFSTISIQQHQHQRQKQSSRSPSLVPSMVSGLGLGDASEDLLPFHRSPSLVPTISTRPTLSQIPSPSPSLLRIPSISSAPSGNDTLVLTYDNHWNETLLNTTSNSPLPWNATPNSSSANENSTALLNASVTIDIPTNDTTDLAPPPPSFSAVPSVAPTATFGNGLNGTTALPSMAPSLFFIPQLSVSLLPSLTASSLIQPPPPLGAALSNQPISMQPSFSNMSQPSPLIDQVRNDTLSSSSHSERPSLTPSQVLINSSIPSLLPSSQPSLYLSSLPSQLPSTQRPSQLPSSVRTRSPSTAPSLRPSGLPSNSLFSEPITTQQPSPYNPNARYCLGEENHLNTPHVIVTSLEFSYSVQITSMVASFVQDMERELMNSVSMNLLGCPSYEIVGLNRRHHRRRMRSRRKPSGRQAANPPLLRAEYGIPSSDIAACTPSEPTAESCWTVTPRMLLTFNATMFVAEAVKEEVMEVIQTEFESGNAVRRAIPNSVAAELLFPQTEDPEEGLVAGEAFWDSPYMYILLAFLVSGTTLLCAGWLYRIYRRRKLKRTVKSMPIDPKRGGDLHEADPILEVISYDSLSTHESDLQPSRKPGIFRSFRLRRKSSDGISGLSDDDEWDTDETEEVLEEMKRRAKRPSTSLECIKESSMRSVDPPGDRSMVDKHDASPTEGLNSYLIPLNDTPQRNEPINSLGRISSPLHRPDSTNSGQLSHSMHQYTESTHSSRGLSYSMHRPDSSYGTHRPGSAMSGRISHGMPSVVSGRTSAAVQRRDSAASSRISNSIHRRDLHGSPPRRGSVNSRAISRRDSHTSSQFGQGRSSAVVMAPNPQRGSFPRSRSPQNPKGDRPEPPPAVNQETMNPIVGGRQGTLPFVDLVLTGNKAYSDGLYSPECDEISELSDQFRSQHRLTSYRTGADPPEH